MDDISVMNYFVPYLKSVKMFNCFKRKVKLSLCLTKCHTIKTYDSLNSATRHEEVLVSGGIAPCILNLGI
jgi:hypothetical protein